MESGCSLDSASQPSSFLEFMFLRLVGSHDLEYHTARRAMTACQLKPMKHAFISMSSRPCFNLYISDINHKNSWKCLCLHSSCLFYRFLMTALHMANKEVTLIDKLLLVVVQLPKFPTWLLDIPFADVFLDQFCDSHLEKQELSLVTQASGQEKELVRAFMLHTQCKEALLMWRKNCKDKANYRFTTYIIHVHL